MSENKKQTEEEPTENVDFNKLIEIINEKIIKVREHVSEEGRQEYDDLLADLYGVISIYDNWLKENNDEINKLLNSLGEKPKKRSPIITLN